MTNRLFILAEGDSWFAYPPKWLIFTYGVSNVLAHLRKITRNKTIIASLASNGDTAVNMFSKRNVDDIRALLAKCQYDFLLLSAGGNDIVGEEDIMPVLYNRTDERTGVDCLNQDAFSDKIAEIRKGYVTILDMVGEFPEATRPIVVGHKYDFVFPDPQGAVFLSGLYKNNGGKSWIYPGMRRRGIKDKEEMRAITTEMLRQFGDMLDDLAESYDYFHVAQTQGLLKDPKRYYRNEIHPNGAGTEIIAQKLWETMKAALKSKRRAGTGA